MLKEECEAIKRSGIQVIRKVAEIKETRIGELNCRLKNWGNELLQADQKVIDFEESRKVLDYEQQITELTQALILFPEEETQWRLQKANFEQQIKLLSCIRKFYVKPSASMTLNLVNKPKSCLKKCRSLLVRG